MSTDVSSDGELTNFFTSLVINGVVAVLAFIVFCILRPRVAWCYEARLSRLSGNPIESVPRGFFSWIRPALAVDEDAMFISVGLDAVMHLRFLKLAMWLFSIVGLFGWVVLIPLNVTGGGDLGGLSYISMANVVDESTHLWGHLVAVYFATAVTLYLFYRQYKDYVRLRHAYLKRPGPQMHTVLVQEIPDGSRSDDELMQFFAKKAEGGQVEGAVIARNTKEIDKLTDNREESSKKLEKARAKLERGGERPEHRLGKVPCTGRKVDTINYCSEEIERLNREITAAQALPQQPTGAGFVSFSSVILANTAAQVLHVANPFQWMVRMAPAPVDVHWRNLQMSYRSRMIRTVLMAVATFFLIFFWMIPIAFVSALSSLDNLIKILPFLRPLLDTAPVVKGFIAGFLPTLGILIFNALLPKLLRAMSRLQGIEAHTWIERAVLNKFFLFELFNVFLGSVIVGSIFQVMSQIIDHPAAIVSLLSVSLPKVANFFTNYVMLEAMSGVLTRLLRLSTVLVGAVKLKFFAKTPRERDEATDPGHEEYGEELPQEILIFVIAIVYAPVAPLVLPFAVLYFALGYLVRRYNYLFVFIPEQQDGGYWWNMVFYRCMVGLVIMHVTIIGMFGTRLAPIQAGLVVPLPIITILFARLCYGMFEKPGEYLPVETAYSIKQEDEARDFDLRTAYVQPGLMARPLSPEIPRPGPAGPLRRSAQQVAMANSRPNITPVLPYQPLADAPMSGPDASLQTRASDYDAERAMLEGGPIIVES